MDIVIKQTDTDIIPLFPVPIPQVEHGFQKRPVALRRKGKTVAAMLLFQRVQTGDKLKVAAAHVFQVLIDRLPPSARRAGDHTKQVKIDLLFLQQPHRPLYDGPGAFSLGINPVCIVKLPHPVHRNSHKEAVIPEKICPFLVDQHPIGLNGVFHQQSGACIFSLKRNELLIEFQPPQHWFAPLKGKADPPLRQRHSLLHQLLQRLLGHKSHVRDFPQGSDILIETIPTAQIATAGGRFNQNRNSVHLLALPSV